jgi:hypothetical protein
VILFSHALQCFLSLLCFLFTATAFEPDFVFPLENVTVAQGRDATFTCVVNNLGGYRVSGESGSSGSAARVRICFVLACFIQLLHLIVSQMATHENG